MNWRNVLKFGIMERRVTVVIVSDKYSCTVHDYAYLFIIR